jgi:hypothetical protein
MNETFARRAGQFLIALLGLGCFVAGLLFAQTATKQTPQRATRLKGANSVTIRNLPGPSPSPVLITPDDPNVTDANGRGKFIQVSFTHSLLRVELKPKDPLERIDREAPLLIHLTPKDGLEVSPPILLWAQFPKRDEAAPQISEPIAFRGVAPGGRAWMRVDASMKVCHRNSKACRRVKERVTFEFVVPSRK